MGQSKQSVTVPINSIAASQPGATSFQDRLCLLTAKRYDFICVTNDKSLRRLCEKEKVPTLWGLQLILELHRFGGIPTQDALDIVQKIHEAIPKHITPDIIKRFGRFLRESDA